MVDDVVGGEAHAEEGRGGVQVHRHAGPRVHVLADALQPRGLQESRTADRLAGHVKVA